MKSIYALFSAAGVIGILAYLGLWLGLFIGWVMNLIEVFQLFAANAPLTTLFIWRIIGVFLSPLGGILGWF